MAEQFKVGDVVQLLSGGPKMTVARGAEADAEGHVFCVWFDAAGALRNDRVTPAVLTRAEQPQAPSGKTGAGARRREK